MRIYADTEGFGRCAGCRRLDHVFSMSCLCLACLDEGWMMINGGGSDDIRQIFPDYLGDDDE